MNDRDTCHACHQPIPTGLAHLRSESLQQVAYHGHCLDVLRAAREVVAPVPVQRRGGSLSERLAAAERERMSA